MIASAAEWKSKLRHRLSRTVVLLGAYALFLSPLAPSAAEEPVPTGPQFQVNSYRTSTQRGSKVAADALGNFVVVWHSEGSYGNDASEYSIQGQRYDTNGAPLGGQFQVNSYTTSYQRLPAVAANAPSHFVVVWESIGSYGTDSSSFSIQGQRYDASGTPVESQFQVNTYTTNSQGRTDIAADTDGNFVVVWHSNGSNATDSSSFSIQGQRYDASGTPVGSQFQVNSYTTSYQVTPELAADAVGNFVVVWASIGSYGTDASGGSIQGQRYDTSGTPVGGQFQVNTYTTNTQYEPAVAADAEGNFVVVWYNNGSVGNDTDGYSIQGQHYDNTGTPVGGQFQVNTYTTDSQYFPTVAADAEGSFVVVWGSQGSYGTDQALTSIQGQRYDTSGTPVGGQFQVNTYTTSAQFGARVARSGPGRKLVVVWQSFGSYGTDRDGTSIQAQRFAGPTVFTDDFESGDTSAWSRAVP